MAALWCICDPAEFFVLVSVVLSGMCLQYWPIYCESKAVGDSTVISPQGDYDAMEMQLVPSAACGCLELRQI